MSCFYEFLCLCLRNCIAGHLPPFYCNPGSACYIDYAESNESEKNTKVPDKCMCDCCCESIYTLFKLMRDAHVCSLFHHYYLTSIYTCRRACSRSSRESGGGDKGRRKMDQSK